MNEFIKRSQEQEEKSEPSLLKRSFFDSLGGHEFIKRSNSEKNTTHQ